MPSPKVEVITPDKEREHIDGKAKRMQVFLKKIAKSRKVSYLTSPTFPLSFKSESDKTPCTTPIAELPVTPGTTEKRPEKSGLDLLRQYEKDVKSALTYYEVILSKGFDLQGFNQKLPGTATAVLESIINAESTVETCLSSLMKMKEFELEAEDVVKPRKSKLYNSITDLIRLSDDVLFDPYLHSNIDKTAAYKAVKNVAESLSELYEYVIPRITKYSVNIELLSCCSGNSSSNSLDALDNIPEVDLMDNVITNHSKCPNTSWPHRDSGNFSEISSSFHNESNQSLDDHPPPKPPLPNSNRVFYGNFSNQIIRKTVSQPDDLAIIKNKEDFGFKIPRPISEMASSGSSGFLNQTISSLGSESNRSSKSSLSSCNSLNNSCKTGNLCESNSELPSAPSIKRRIDSQSDKQVDSGIDHAQIGMSNETFSNIQKHSDRYELLMKSSLCLCGNEEDLLSEDVSPPPLYPKRKQKHTVDNYLNIVEGYDVAEYHERRPSSFYDNLPVPNIHDITEDELMNGDGLPKLPPKRGSYNRAHSSDEPPMSPKKTNRVSRKSRSSRRDSSECYKEDNVPALDCKDVSRFLVYKESDVPLLCGGTVDALIVHASEVYNALFYKAFIATYRTFISPAELICKLLYRINRFYDKKNISISQSALKLLIDVIDEMFEEFDKSLFDQLRSQVHRLLNHGELKLAKDLRDRIVNYCIKLEVNSMPIYQPEKSFSNVFDFKSLDLAQQMCVLDTDYFVKIELPEVLRWGKEQSETFSPNLSRFISHFNSMSFWVRTLVLNETRQQEREKIYKKFLKIMRILRKLNNFSSFLAIMSALDSTPVRRLEWPKHFTEELAEDTKLIDSASAFKSYRIALAEAKPPCIPYLGLILTDITFVHLGNPQELPDGKINFLKRWQQFNILDTVRRFKETLYNFERNEKILDVFNEYEEHLDEDSMWDKSMTLRPRGK